MRTQIHLHNLLRMTVKVLMACLIVYGGFLVAMPVHALTVNIYPSTKDGTDDTTETLSEITSDDSAVNPDTLSAVAASDGTYTVDKGNIMRFSAFNAAAIPAGSTITGAVLHLEYGAENGYSPTTAYVRYMASTTALVNTTINPTDITNFSGDQTFDMYATDPGSVDTMEELAAMDIEFTNGDSGGADAIHFDYIYITVTYTPPPFRVSGTLYSDEGVTAITATHTIKMAVGTSSPTVHSTTTLASNGSWSFSVDATNATTTVPTFTIWVDGTTTKATTVVKASTTANVALTNIPLYKDRVIVTHASSTAGDLSLNETGWTLASDSLPTVATSTGKQNIVTIGDYIYIMSAQRGVLRAHVSAPTKWEYMGNAMAVSREGGGVAVIGEYIYTFGGCCPDTTIQRASISDPLTWTTLTETLPVGFEHGNMAIVNDRIYLYGSYTAGSRNWIQSAPLSNPTSWTQSGNTLPSAYNDGTLVTVGDYLYIYGGYNGSSGINTIWRAPVSDPTSWSATGSTIPAASFYGRAAVVGDYVYIFGGSANAYAIWRAPVTNPTSVTDTGNSLPASTLSNANIYVANDRLYLVPSSGTSIWSTAVSVDPRITTADMTFYDSDDDSDIGFNATSTGAVHSLVVTPGNELYVPPHKRFVAGGPVTIQGNASSSATDGSLRLTASSTYIQTGTTTVAGSFYASSTATYTHGNGSLVFNATTTGKVIQGGSVGLGSTTFNGTNGGWTFSDNASTTNLSILNGSVTSANALTVRGNFTNNGTFSGGSGTQYFTASTTLLNGTLAGTSQLGNVYVNTGGDGATWVTASATAANSWRSVAYGNGTFVAVSIDGTNRVMTSPDGITWTARSATEANEWTSVTYGSGKFVAVARTGTNRVMTSTDGVTWATSSAAEANEWQSVTYGDGTFVAVARNGTNRVMTSTDGSTWTARSAAAAHAWQSVTYGGGTFVAVAASSTASNLVMTSSTGTVWTSRTVPVRGRFTSIAYGNGTFVAVNGSSSIPVMGYANTNRVITSRDGITWRMREVPGPQWQSVTYGNGMFVAVSNVGSSSAMISSDGITWVYKATPAKMPWHSVTFGGDRFVAVAATTTVGSTSVMVSSGSKLTFVPANASTTDLTVSASSTLLAPQNLTIAGNFVNNSTTTLMASTTYFNGTGKSSSGYLTGGASLLAAVVTGSQTFSSVASTTDLTVSSGGTLTAPSLYSISGNYTGNGTYSQSSGRTQFTGTSKSWSGSGSTNFADLKISGSITSNTLTQATATALIIDNGATFTAPTALTVVGSVTNGGTLLANSGTIETRASSMRYLGGVDGGGSAAGTNADNVYALAGNGNYLYVGRVSDGTPCSQTAGSAIGCEIQIYDISNSSSPTYVAGRDSSGDSGGSGATTVRALTVNGSYLYVVKNPDTTACTQTAGSATGCEIMIFDISSSTSPTYVGGVDSSGSATGTGGGIISKLNISGNYLYVGKWQDNTACSQVAGSAIGCELMVFDLSSSTRPTYVAGRDSTGDSSGTGASYFTDIDIAGSYLYAVGGYSSTPCGQTPGSAIGCELQVYDISTPTNPVYVAGRDQSGSAAGTVAWDYSQSVIVRNGFLYIGIAAYNSACSQTAGSAEGCELQVYDISSSTNPIYVAGRDALGNSDGSGLSRFVKLAATSTQLYVAKANANSGVACAETSGNATGCEFMTFDISSSTNPVYVEGRDVAGALTGSALATAPTGALMVHGSLLIAGLASGSSTACSQIAGSAAGCEIMVYSRGIPSLLSGTLTGANAFNTLIASGTGPTIIGVNASTTDFTVSANASTSLPSQFTIAGNATLNGTTTQSSGTTTFSGTGKSMAGTGTTTFANMQVNGTITSSSLHRATTTNLTIASGAQFTAPITRLSITGNYSNSGTFSHNSGTTTFSGTSKSIAGTLTGTSAFNNVDVTGSYSASNNASTSALIIQSGGSFTAPPLLSIAGNYTNDGTFVAGAGTTTLNGTSQQTATGTMTGTSAFANLEIINTSQVGSTTQSVVFGASASTTDTFTMWASSSAAFLAGESATSTFQNIALMGSTSGSVFLRSTSDDTQWRMKVPGTQKFVTYTNVKDGNACSGDAYISATDGTSKNAGNNSCWDFPIVPTPTISSAQNQTFAVGDNFTPMSTLTITEHATTPSITADNDIRLVIATSSANMRWQTGFIMPTFGGTAITKVETAFPMTEGGDSILVINVTEDFLAGDTLTLSDFGYNSFSAVTPAVAALSIRTGGQSDTDDDDTDDKTVTIKGTVALTNHGSGQVADAFSFPSDTGVEVYAFRMTPSSESATTSALTFRLSGVDGVVTADLTNATLYRDSDGNQTLDAGVDAQVGGSGTVSISGQTGTITFSTPFLATTTHDYLLMLDTANIRPGDMMTLALAASDVTTAGVTSLVSITPSGSVSGVQHVRSGGGAGPSSIGGDAPAGQGQQSGGGQGGGQGGIDPDAGGSALNSEPGFNPPSSTGSSHNEWTSGSNAYTSNGSYATAASTNLRQSYADFSFNVPTNNTIDGIEVQLEANASTAAGTIQAVLSWDGDTSTSNTKTTGTLTTTDAVYTLGGPSDTWGHSWTPSETDNTNFRLRLIAQPSSNTISLDAIQVKIYHHASGGGGGGGGIVRRPSLPPTYYGYGTTRGLVAGASTTNEGHTMSFMNERLERLVQELQVLHSMLSTHSR